MIESGHAELSLVRQCELVGIGRSRAIGTANSTMSDYLKRAERAGVVWPEAAEWDLMDNMKCCMQP